MENLVRSINFWDDTDLIRKIDNMFVQHWIENCPISPFDKHVAEYWSNLIGIECNYKLSVHHDLEEIHFPSEEHKILFLLQHG